MKYTCAGRILIGNVFFIFLGLALISLSFLAGFKLGLFLFPQEKNIAEIKTAVSPMINSFSEPEAPLKPEKNFCDQNIQLSTQDEKIFCLRQPKLSGARGIEIDLTNNKALLYNEGKLIKIFPLSYQSPENKWYEAPTGYYRIGVKHQKHLSSLFPVVMPYSIQLYEDFFIHGIPYYEDGSSVSSSFTGGCLRFENEIAKEIYDFAKTGDEVVVYKTFDDLEIKPEFSPPVDLKNYWIKQRFINPYRISYYYGGTSILKLDYYQHTGVDFAPEPGTEKFSIYAIDDGRVVKIQTNNGDDHGLGNTIILEHQINNEKIYSLYSHLSFFRINLKENDMVKKGEIIAEVGSTGYGCQNYWRIGNDGCQSLAPADNHLHFEIKKAPVLENPEGGKSCQTTSYGEEGFCYGYTPDYPQEYGYLNPIEFIFNKKI